MTWEVLLKHIEELHKSSGDELGVGKIGGKGHLAGEVAQNRIVGVRLGVVSSCSGMTNSEVSRCERI